MDGVQRKKVEIYKYFLLKINLIDFVFKEYNLNIKAIQLINN